MHFQLVQNLMTIELSSVPITLTSINIVVFSDSFVHASYRNCPEFHIAASSLETFLYWCLVLLKVFMIPIKPQHENSPEESLVDNILILLNLEQSLIQTFIHVCITFGCTDVLDIKKWEIKN